MKRILIDLRIFLAVVAALGVALAVVSAAFLGIYNAPIDHVVEFQHLITAKVVNWSTIVSWQNFTESGVPIGALLEFGWWLTTGPGVAVSILAANGTSATWGTLVGCGEGPATFGTCGWTTDNHSFTISISQSISAPGFPMGPSANYTASVGFQGWYSYSTPAR